MSARRIMAVVAKSANASTFVTIHAGVCRPERLVGRIRGNLWTMPARKPPATVITAVVLAVLLALLFGGVTSLFGFRENDQDLAIGGLVIGVLLLALAWRLWQGGRGAQLAGVAVGAAVIAAGLWQARGVASLVVFAALGLALIVSLTVPASARAYFRASRGGTGPR
jgi:hypothetical protein